MGYTPVLALAVFWTLYSWAIILVALRIRLRKIHLRQILQTSDYCILGSLLFAMAHGCLCTWMIAMKLKSHRGLSYTSGYPEIEVAFYMGFKGIEKYLKVAYAGTLIYICSIYLSKAAFLAFYYTMYARFSKNMKAALHGVTAFTVCSFLANMLLNLLWCLPLNRNWTFDRHPKCPAAVGLPSLVTGTASNIITDFLLMIIPLALLRSLMLGKREYIGIAFVVFLGSVCIISAAIRFCGYYSIMITKQSQMTQISIDGLILWGNVDIAVALIAVCLPAFRVLLRNGRSTSITERSLSMRNNSIVCRGRGSCAGNMESQVELRRMEMEGCERSVI
ncbi:hypothetical protein BDD12DRAFT_840647 [Trichophaea hybrida]|nr:hypothetical protein BDD12DRAFT_840647 [Trichophaea hybrida]